MDYFKQYPTTSFFLLLNALLFGLVQGGVLDVRFFIFLPEVLHSGSFLHNFMHTGWLHFAFNTMVFLFAGPFLERDLGAWRFLSLILGISIIFSVGIWFLIDYPVMGFSGVLMGLFGFGALYFSPHTYEREVFRSLLIANVLIGLHPQITFWGHVIGAGCGLLTYGCHQLLNKIN